MATRTAAKATNYTHYVLAVLLLLLTGAVFAQSVGFDILFFWDDNRYITENPLLPLTLETVVRIFTEPYFASYAPLLLLSFGLDELVFGGIPLGFHLPNVLLHVLATALVFYITRRLLKTTWLALVVALLFAVHPLQVESVAWISERKNTLSAVFFLASFATHIRSHGRIRSATASRGYMVATWVLYLLAILVKPVVAAGPLLYMAYDVFWLRRSVRDVLIRSAVPLFIGIVGALLVIGTHQAAGGIKDFRGANVFQHIQLMLLVAGDYFGSVLWPLQLNNFYIYNIDVITQWWRVAFGAVLLLAMAAYFVLPVFIERRVARMGIMWIVAFMIPVANIIPVSIQRADRYMYFPLIGVGLIVAGTIQWVERRAKAAQARTVAQTAVAVAMGALIVLTALQLPVWTNSLTLWRDHLRSYPDSVTGNINLAGTYFAIGNYDRATVLYERLLELDPDDLRPAFQLGRIAQTQGRHGAASEYYARAIEIAPEEPVLYNNLGFSLQSIGQYDGALAAYQVAVTLDPDYYRAYVNIGITGLVIREYDLAQVAFLNALRLQPNAAEGVSGMCMALAGQQDPQAALPYCQSAVERAPENGLYLGRTAHVLLLLDRPQDALFTAQQAVRYAPELALGHRTLGDALLLMGRYGEARDAYNAALAVDPDNPGALDGLQQLAALSQ